MSCRGGKGGRGVYLLKGGGDDVAVALRRQDVGDGHPGALRRLYHNGVQEPTELIGLVGGVHQGETATRGEQAEAGGLCEDEANGELAVAATTYL